MTQDNQGEIDLPELFRRFAASLGKMSRAAGRAFLVSVVFLLRRWLPLGLSLFLGFILSFTFWKTSKSYYTSDLMLRVNIEPLNEVISYVNRLTTFCIQTDRSKLSEALSLNNTENIRDISAFWVIDNGNDGIPDYVDYKGSHNVYDSINPRMIDRMSIRVRTVQSQELGAIRNGIISYINSDSLLKQRNILRLKQQNELLARLEKDIEQLDSLQKIKYFEESKNIRNTPGQMVFLQEQKTQLLYDDIYMLYNRKQDLEEKSGLYRDIVTVLSDFSIPTERDNGKLYYSLIFIPLFFVITLILLIIIANRDKLKEIYRKY